MNLQVADLIQDDCNTYEVLGLDYDVYCKPSEVSVLCIRGPHVGKTRVVQYATVLNMFDEKRLFVVDKDTESV